MNRFNQGKEWMRTVTDNRTRNPWIVFNITDTSKNKNENSKAKAIIVQLTIALPWGPSPHTLLGAPSRAVDAMG